MRLLSVLYVVLWGVPMGRYPRIRASVAGMAGSVSASAASASEEGQNAARWVSHLCSVANELLAQAMDEGVTVEIDGLEMPALLRKLLGMGPGEKLKLRFRLAESEESEATDDVS